MFRAHTVLVTSTERANQIKQVEGETDLPTGGKCPVVAMVAKSAKFEYGWNGFKFYTSHGELVAVQS